VLFKRGTFAEVIEERQAGVVDEHVERLDTLDRCLSLRSVGHVQGQGRDPPILVHQRLARTGVRPLRASPQRLLDQRLSDTAIGPGHQNCFVCGCHTHSSLFLRVEYATIGCLLIDSIRNHELQID
jgi:hypothetical protein